MTTHPAGGIARDLRPFFISDMHLGADASKPRGAAATAPMLKHALASVAPLAVIDGPIVAVIAASLASQGVVPLWAVALVVIAADLVGDAGLHAFGRWRLAVVTAARSVLARSFAKRVNIRLWRW